MKELLGLVRSGERGFFFRRAGKGVLRFPAPGTLRKRGPGQGRRDPHLLADHHAPESAHFSGHRPQCLHRGLLQLHDGPAHLPGWKHA